jgi:aromatase
MQEGYTENSIVVFTDLKRVFDWTNQIELWPKLFTEYERVEILNKQENEITFRLTMYPEGDKPAKSWISRRLIDHIDKTASAERLDPVYPFKFMKIRWTYEELPLQMGTIMTWIQQFEVDSRCPWTQAEMESYLNSNTRIQMKAVKQALEKMAAEAIR